MYTTKLFKLPQILSPILNLVSVNPNLHCNNCFCTLTICAHLSIQFRHSIYLDYSKAFDKVSHKILLEKLWSMGINNNLWFWFQNHRLLLIPIDCCNTDLHEDRQCEYVTNTVPQPPSQLADISITHDEVFQVLCSLITNKASGSDNIGPTLLKNCASSLTYPLHHLFSLSLQTSVIPSEWKYHTIIPIFKADDKSNVKNYRPISLLSNISKVLERIVYNRTLQITSNFITHTQFANPNLHCNNCFCTLTICAQLSIQFKAFTWTILKPSIRSLIKFSLRNCGLWG